MQKITFLILLLVFATSCCSTRLCKIERAEKRITKITNKFPELLSKDTLIIKDTVTFNEVIADTSFIYNPLALDTIIITKDKLTIKYIKKDSIIYLSGNCEADTIYITNTIPYNKIVVRELTWRESLKNYGYFLFSIAALLLVVRICFPSIFKILNIFK
tara:strand:+ start:26196 stop:26672 length:477 start_codon:yes stop_codon:yes gene_type:complete